jgi:uncharacterized protein YdeI (BOF family)
MRRILAAATIVLAATVWAFLPNPAVNAQAATAHSVNSSSQDAATPPQAGQNDSNETKAFTGKIVRSGDKLVLTDATGKTTYQLDDQVKAKEFLNKNVKVKGTLDVSTGTIRVSDIEPV